MDYRYSIETEGVKIVEYYGTDSILNIPSSVDDTPVISVEKKAFMGCKMLVEVHIPPNVEVIEDYAFAQCTHLQKVVFKGTLVKMGRKIFEGCKRITNISFSGINDDVSFLAASVVNKLPAVSLLTDSDIGSSFWLKRYDLALKSFIARDDMDGYEDAALCGEEDISYDGIGSIDGEMPGESASFVKEAGKNKCYLCLMRLMHCIDLSDEARECFEKYIINHGPDTGASRNKPGNAANGGGSLSDVSIRGTSWALVKEDLNNNPEYIELYLNILKPDKDMVAFMLNDIADSRAMLKSVLIGYSNKEETSSDVFAGLML